MPDEQIAESSTATEVEVPVEKLDDHQRAEWLKTGNLPKRAAPAAAEPAVEEEAPEAETEAESDSGPEEPKPPKSKGADKRVQELLKERKELRERVEALERAGKPTEPERKKDPEPAAELKEPVKPKEADFDDWGKFQEARDKYFEDFAEYKAAVKVQEAQEKQSKAEQEREQRKANEQIEQSWRERVNAALKKYPDFGEKAFRDDLHITPVMDAFILDSEHGADVLYKLGEDRENAERIAKLPPLQQAKELSRIEFALNGSATAPPRATRASPVPTELPKGGSPQDDSPFALAARYKDRPDLYQAEMNRRDRAARQRK